MNLYRTIVLLFLSVFVVLPLKLSAQDQIIDQIYASLRAGDIPTATSRVDSALAVYFQFAPTELAEIHALRALLYNFTGQKEKVRRHLLLALELNPNLELDPLYFSPNLRNLLTSLKSNIAGESVDNVTTDLPEKQIRYLPLPDPRVGASWRSLLVPGWGQIYKGQQKRGIVMAGLTGGLVAAAITSHVLRQRARDDYLKATVPADIQTAYRRYNRFHKWRNTLMLLSGLSWALNFLDATFTPSPKTSFQKVGGLQPKLLIEPNSLSLVVTF